MRIYHACTNRAYYSAFQAAVAVLAKFGIKREKLDHGWVQAEFSAQLISRRKILPGKLKSTLTKMQLARDNADYSGTPVNPKIANRQLGRAAEMVESIEKAIEQ